MLSAVLVLQMPAIRPRKYRFSAFCRMPGLAAVPFGWCYVWWQTRRLAQAEQTADGGKTAEESAGPDKDGGDAR